MYFIELLLTRKCNQDCYYCTTKSKEDNTSVDLDYLKWVLDQLPKETGVEITGGEIGLVENLDDVYKTVRDHPHIKYIRVLSNGLVRRVGVDWIREVDYWEHLIYDIRGYDVIRFYNDLNFIESHKYIIVTTDITTKSLLKHWKYFEGLNFFRDNFFYKLINHKAKVDIRHFYDDLVELYTRLDDKYFQRMLLAFKLKSYLKDERALCQRYSPNPFVDLQRKQLGHCAINVNKSNRVPFNSLNLIDMIHGVLQDDPQYCRKCYSFDNGKGRTPQRNRSYEQ